MISILLPFKNACTTIQSCLASILNQTCAQFEILAIDDHSNDGSTELVENWPDARIQLLKNPGFGLIDALNFGLHKANYPIIARMDADDLMRSDRLKLQLEYLTKNPNITLVSSCVSLFSDQPIKEGYRHYIDWQNNVITHQQILDQRFIESPLAHPSVMFRKFHIIKAGGYIKGDFPEDYELWLRLLSLGYRMEKMPQTLLDWRDSTDRLSRTDPLYNRSAFSHARALYLSKLAILKERPVAFWGAGRKTRQRAKFLINMGVQPCCWIDIDPKKIGQSLNGIQVIDLQTLQIRYAEARPFVLIYVTNHGAREIIQEQLQSLGLLVGQDYLAVG